MNKTWTVESLIEELKKYDKDMKVIGFSSISLQGRHKTETKVVENQVSTYITGWENVVCLN